VHKRRGLIALVSTVLAVGSVAAVGAAASSASAAPAPSAVVSHAVSGCGEAGTTVNTPARAGGQLSAAALGLPASSDALLTVAAQDHVQWLSTLSCALRPQVRTTAQRFGTRNQTVVPTLNWSGYQENTSSTPTYVQAYWKVPKVIDSTDGVDATSDWPGLGSGESKTNAELIQDGSEEAIEGSQTLYILWYEIFPNEAEVEITNAAIQPRPGNQVSASAAYSAKTHKATFDVCNLTRKKCVSISQTSNKPNNQAEWIVERPGLCFSNGQAEFPPLADYGTLTFTKIRYNKSGTLSDSKTRDEYLMYDQKDVLLSSPGAISHGGTQFTATHHTNGIPFSLGSC
jgi:hypothetical protein